MAKAFTEAQERIRAQLKIQELYPDLIRQYTAAYCQHCRHFIYGRCCHLLLPVTSQGDPCLYCEPKTIE